MAISLKTHKLLWGRAAHRCTICKIELATDKTEVDDESLIGDECHIIARRDDGPRGDAVLESGERDNYDNLILLCKNHHKQVDDQRNIYTVEKLRQIKVEHEAWVREKLETYDRSRQRDDEVYATYIEEWEHKAHVAEWYNWTSGLLATQPYIVLGVVDDLRELPRWLLSRVWPKRYEGLDNAFANFRRVLSDLFLTFFEYAESDEWRYLTVKFYKRGDWNSHYDRDLQRYEYHVDLIKTGKPPALPGRLAGFDKYRSHVESTGCEPLKIHKRRLNMTQANSLAHAKWECKYHIVWIPKYRKQTLYADLRRELGPVLRELARQRESEILEGHLRIDHAHILIAIPPKYAVSHVVGYLKGKSAIHIARNHMGRQRNFTGEHFWARGYYVSTVGLDEVVIRNYIQQQEAEDQRLDQLSLFDATRR